MIAGDLENIETEDGIGFKLLIKIIVNNLFADIKLFNYDFLY